MHLSRGAAAEDADDAPNGACSRSSGIRECHRTTTQPGWRYAALHGNVRHQLSEAEGLEVFSVLMSVVYILSQAGYLPCPAVENAIRILAGVYSGT